MTWRKSDEKIRCKVFENTRQPGAQRRRQDGTPEQNNPQLENSNELTVTHESIYSHAHWIEACADDLHTCLRCQKQRHKRYGTFNRCIKPVNQIAIDERPVIVEKRVLRDHRALDRNRILLHIRKRSTLHILLFV